MLDRPTQNREFGGDNSMSTHVPPLRIPWSEIQGYFRAFLPTHAMSHLYYEGHCLDLWHSFATLQAPKAPVPCTYTQMLQYHYRYVIYIYMLYIYIYIYIYIIYNIKHSHPLVQIGVIGAGCPAYRGHQADPVPTCRAVCRIGWGTSG